MRPFCILVLATKSLLGASVATNYSGYLVDYYCYSLSLAGGTSVDGSNVVTGPDAHTKHCLRDVPQCRDGYFLAENRATGSSPADYHIKFKLDDASHERALKLVDSFPKGGATDDLPLRVIATGTHEGGDGYLRDAFFEVCSGDAGCDGACSGACDTPQDLDFTLRPGALLVLHVICMSLSWGCMLPLGVLWAHNLRKHHKKVKGAPLWFAGHRILQSTGVILQLLGFFFALLWKKAAHFKLPHEIIGLVVVVIGTCQPLNAFARNLSCIGHPHPDGTRSAARKAWEVLHKGLGYGAVLLGMINAVLGPIHASNLRFDTALVVVAAVFVGLSLGILVCVGLVLQVRRALGLPELGEDKRESDVHSTVVKEVRQPQTGWADA
eukprot:CAMPEP_0171111160 /NCGR_PEP_ID=MMETSP0766_2-20121228/74084_1 /TAXON_ID=439317 /ORGANISM="Gambierdiscus australes, Strain CAWD 149" /LENGTH=380 /DNA_ID=CAMNT_0011573119 /DNA_START=149 /DNA_END=1291 /DNA_ORIENTATION=-